MRTASMQAYQQALPREATVRRRVAALQLLSQPTTRRMRMDAMSLVYGDVVELQVGDVAGADLRVVECSDDCVVDQTTLMGEDGEDEEESKQTESKKRVTISSPPRHLQQYPLRCSNIVPMTASVLQGSAVAVVVSTGDRTLWGQMVKQHQWPPPPRAALRKETGTGEEQTNLIV